MDYIDEGKVRNQKLGRWTYKGMRKANPKHWIGFVGIHKRHREYGTKLDVKTFERSIVGFKAFIDTMGPIPAKMTKPTVGRKNHNRGYYPDNMQWEDMSDNSRESITRNKQKLYTHKMKAKIARARIELKECRDRRDKAPTPQAKGKWVKRIDHLNDQIKLWRSKI